MDEENAEITLSWEISDYDLADYTDGKFIVSPVFKIFKLQNSEWVLKLGLEDKSLKFQLVRCGADKGPDEVTICCSLFLVGHKDPLLICASKELIFQRNDMLECSVHLKVLELKKIVHWSRNVLTIQCNMSGHLLSDICPVHYTGITNVIASAFEFQWKATPIISRYSESPKVFYSDKTFCYVRCDKVSRKEAGSLARNDFDFKILGSVLKSVCVLRNSDGYQCPRVGQPIVLTKGNEVHMTRNRMCELTSKHKVSIFNLNCEFRISNGSYVSRDAREVPVSDFPVISSGELLMAGLRKMYSEQSLCDFSLETDEGEVFNVHSVILASRSPVFHRLLNSDFKETNTKVMNIVDTDAETMRSFLNFVYGDKVDGLSFDSARKLYIVAAEFEVSELQATCAGFLVKSVSLDNVCDMLELADRHSDSKMRKVALSFISSNTESVLSSDQWKNVEEKNYLMALDVLKVLALRK